MERFIRIEDCILLFNLVVVDCLKDDLRGFLIDDFTVPAAVCEVIVVIEDMIEDCSSGFNEDLLACARLIESALTMQSALTLVMLGDLSGVGCSTDNIGYWGSLRSLSAIDIPGPGTCV